MNQDMQNQVELLIIDIRLTLKRLYTLMGVWIEWYPYSCGKSYLAQLRAEGKNEQYLRQYVDDIKLTLPPLPGAPDEPDTGAPEGGPLG